MRNELRVFANGKMFYCTLDTYPEITERADWPSGVKLKHAKKMLATLYHDAHGQLIYFNDILEIAGSRYVVTEHNSYWLAQPEIRKMCEVVGNSLENPDLLTSCKNLAVIKKEAR